MLEGRSETLHCGTMCFAVYGRDDVISSFVDYLKTSTILPVMAIFIRTIGSRPAITLTSIEVLAEVLR